MFILNYLRRCYGKRIYIIAVLLVADIIAGIYSGWEFHPFSRHLFICYNIVSGFANILFWLIFFIPIADNIIQERGTFGVSLFCRISRPRYFIKTSAALLLYNVTFFVISMIISTITGLVNGFAPGAFGQIAKLYPLLVLLGYDMLMLAYFTGWISNSSYVMAVVYTAVVTATQIPAVNKYFSLTYLMETFPMSIIVLAICALILSFLTLVVMKYKDCVGIKKGVSI